MTDRRGECEDPAAASGLLHTLREDATDPELSRLERLALVRERAGGMREIRAELEESGLAADISENLDPAPTECFA